MSLVWLASVVVVTEMSSYSAVSSVVFHPDPGAVEDPPGLMDDDSSTTKQQLVESGCCGSTGICSSSGSPAMPVLSGHNEAKRDRLASCCDDGVCTTRFVYGNTNKAATTGSNGGVVIVNSETGTAFRTAFEPRTSRHHNQSAVVRVGKSSSTPTSIRTEATAEPEPSLLMSASLLLDITPETKKQGGCCDSTTGSCSSSSSRSSSGSSSSSKNIVHTPHVMKNSDGGGCCSTGSSCPSGFKTPPSTPVSVSGAAGSIEPASVQHAHNGHSHDDAHAHGASIAIKKGGCCDPVTGACSSVPKPTITSGGAHTATVVKVCPLFAAPITLRRSLRFPPSRSLVLLPTSIISSSPFSSPPCCVSGGCRSFSSYSARHRCLAVPHPCTNARAVLILFMCTVRNGLR